VTASHWISSIIDCGAVASLVDAAPSAPSLQNLLTHIDVTSTAVDRMSPCSQQHQFMHMQADEAACIHAASHLQQSLWYARWQQSHTKNWLELAALRRLPNRPLRGLRDSGCLHS
jgi:hypothetical protein